MLYESFQQDLANIAKITDDHIITHPYPTTVTPSWLGEEMLSYTKGGGKRLRPALCLWSAALVCDNYQKALPAAAAAEIFHTWTLVHDDIIDRDATRRGLPTAHTSLAQHARDSHNTEDASADHFGLSMAILTGDLQQAWALNFITEASGTQYPAHTTLTLINRLLTHVYPILLGGEAIDVEFEHREIDSISPEEILRMLEMKTACLLEFSAQAGIVCGLELDTFDHPLVKAAGDFAYSAGLAFQLQDDILGVFADETKLGKPVGSDFSARKVTLLLAETIKLSNAEQNDFIHSLLGAKSISENDLEQARQIMRDCGALEMIQEKAQHYIDAAQLNLQKLPNSPAKERLAELAEFMIKRNF